MTRLSNVANGSGPVVLQSRCLARLVDEEPHACRILDELQRIVACVWSRANLPERVARGLPPYCANGAAWSELRTDSALYRMRRSRHTRRLGSAVGRLRERFGLSLREVEVARLLADGLSTRDLSAMLHVSSHTARHHTENVPRKLRVRRRAEVGRRLRGG